MRLLLALRHRPLATLAGLARNHGDVAPFRLGRQEVLLLNHPDLAEQVLLAQGSQFVKENAIVARRIAPPRFREDRGLVTSLDRARHVRGRRLLQPAFSAEAVTDYQGGLAAEAAAIADSWRPGEIDALAETRRIAVSAMVRVILGAPGDTTQLARIGGHLQAIMQPFRLATSLPLDLLQVAHLRTGAAAARASDELPRDVGDLIRAGARRSAGHDLVSLLEGADDLDDDGRRWEALVILLAGTDTTASALAWCLALLALDPDEQERAHAGADASLAVVQEALRLFPPSWYLGRRALAEVSLDGREVARNTVVLLSPFLLHRDPRWYDSPERFRPSRWAEGAPRPARFAYVPFGMGARRCVGERVALRELTIALAEIGARWRYRLASGDAVQPVAAASLRPRALRLRLERRASPAGA